MTDVTDQHIIAAGKVLAKAALLDPRMSAGDEATTLAWAEIIAEAGVTVDDMLPAVVVHYSTSRERIMPADVIRIARERKRARLDRTVGNDTAPPGPQLPPATAAGRKAALAAAAAKLGARHDAETGETFAAAPRPASIESAATRAGKVARARAGFNPDAVEWCAHADGDKSCQLVAGHLGPHHLAAGYAGLPRQAGA